VVAAQVLYRGAALAGTFVTWAFTGATVTSAEALTAQAGAATAAAGATASGTAAIGKAGLMMGRFAVLAGLAVAAYESWSSAIGQNAELKDQTGGIGFWDFMKLHPKEVMPEIDKRMNEKARAKRPEAAAAWAIEQYGSPAAAQAPRAPWAADAAKAVKATSPADIQGSLTDILGGLEKQMSAMDANVGIDPAALRELNSTIEAARAAIPKIDLGAGGPKAPELAAQLDQLTAAVNKIAPGAPAPVASPAGGTPMAPGVAPAASVGLNPQGSVSVVSSVQPSTSQSAQAVMSRQQLVEMARVIEEGVTRGVARALKEAPIKVSVQNDPPPIRAPKMVESGSL
jgi:hypothetical protein